HLPTCTPFPYTTLFRSLEKGSSADLCWKELPHLDRFKAQLKPIVLEHFSKYLNCRDPLEALEAFGKFRILCALRSGPFGVAGLRSEEHTSELQSPDHIV